MNSRNTFHDLTSPIRKTVATKSLPQVKHYFRKRIAKCLNECKLQTLNMKKSMALAAVAENNQHSYHQHRQIHHHPVPVDPATDFSEYEFGWGSDFDDPEEDDDLDQPPPPTQHYGVEAGSSNITVVPPDELVRAMNLVNLNNGKPPTSAPNRYVHQHNHQNVSSPRRPVSEPPPPPLPKCPPPSDLTDCADNVYEVMSVVTATIGDNRKAQLNDDYLMPNTMVAMNHSTAEVAERPLPPIPAHNGESLRRYSWFAEIERDQAETVVRRQGANGCFLVRPSRRAGVDNPYTLTLFYNHRIFHLNIRKRPDHLYALGTAKPKEKTFHYIADMIEFHHEEPIYLTTKGTIAGKTTLISLKNISY